MTRWLYHLARAEEAERRPYVPGTFDAEGFVHASFAPAVRESHRLYLAGDPSVVLLCIDPRALTAEVRVVDTPRGPMPHVHGPIDAAAIRWSSRAVEAFARELPDRLEDGGW